MRPKTILLVILFHFKEFLIRLFGMKSTLKPYKLLVQITNDCDSKCKTCSIWSVNTLNPELKKNELSLLEFESLYSQFGNSLMWLALSGGEVTLHENFTQIVDLAVEKCPRLRVITFSTNGLNPAKILSYSQYIKQKGLDLFVVVSLDGDEKVHDEIRGVPGNYQKAQESYRLLKEAGIKTYFGLTVNHMNEDYIQTKYALDAKKIKAVSLMHSDGIYHRSNKTNNTALHRSMSHIFNHYRLQGLAETIEYIYIGLACRFLLNERKINPVPCEVLSSSLHVFPNGDVHGCMFMPKIGNIKSDKLSTMLNSELTKEQVRLIKEEKCPKCWMNCYAPHSIMQHPIKSLQSLLSEKI